MCWALNHQNIIEIAQGHISLSAAVPGSSSFVHPSDSARKVSSSGFEFHSKHTYSDVLLLFSVLCSVQFIPSRV
jgi:hypothetical protein